MSNTIIKALVSGEIIIKDLPEHVIAELKSILSFDNPNYVNAKRYSKNGYISNNIPEIIQCARIDKFGYVHVPRGTIKILKSVLDKNNISLSIIDGRSVGKPINCTAVFGLRPYQRTAQIVAIKRVQGCILLPCGGGKTVIGVSVIGKLKRTTLIIVHTKDLRDQWIAQLTDKDKIGMNPNDVGQIGDGIIDIKPVTVAIVDSLFTVINDKELRKLIKRFGICIVDEVHHVVSNTFQKILPHVPAKWRIGLTATPEREDGTTKLMYWTIGDELFSYETDQLVKEGYLIKATVVPIETNFQYAGKVDCKATEYVHQMTETLIKDEQRNKLITTIAIKEAINGESVLVLSNRVEHCKILNDIISKNRNIKSFAMTGQVNKLLRQKVLQEMREEKINILIATSLADEGLDILALSRLILALPSKAKGRTMQRIGRIMRPKKGKVAICYDIIDSKVPTLIVRWMKRKRIFRSMNIVIEPSRRIIV